MTTERNYANTNGTASHSYTGDSVDWYGADTDMIDEDDDSCFWGKMEAGILYDNSYLFFNVELDFPRIINQLSYRVAVAMHSTTSSSYVHLFLQKYTNSWETLQEVDVVDNNLDATTYTFDYPNGENISKMRVYADCYYARTGFWDCRVYVYVYEMKAYGYYFEDSKMRFYNGNENLIIGSDTDTAGQKLRLYNGSNIVAFPLLPLTHKLASPIRVYDGAEIKSIGLKQT